MKTVLCTSVCIAPARQRRVFDAAKLYELGDNIASSSLQNAIVLRQEGDQLFLVSGERRWRSISDLAELGTTITYDNQPVPLGHIPYTLLGDLDELAAEEAELSENIHREDLSWQERAAACARIASLRTRQAEARGDAPPTTADISLEVRGSSEGVNHETTRREILVSRHLDNPAVIAAKSVDEAFKILKKEEAKEKFRSLGASVGRTFTADVHRALNEDSLAWMSKCPAEQFDVILTDPPYGMGADEFGDCGGLAEGAHGYKDDYDTFLRCATALAFEGFRITKPQAHAYIFCDFDKFSQLKALMVEAGWNVFRTPFIWFKKSGMRAPWPEQGPQRKYETILYAVKGKRPVLKMVGDVLDFPPDTNLGHAAQKPVALFKELLSRSVMPGDSVLDPFMGSGPVFEAAHDLRAKATGIELDTASFGIAVQRIEKIRAQLELGL